MGLFEHFPYTNFHDLNLDWLLKKIKELLDAKVPAGGNTNQVLTKQSNADYDMVWKDAPALPTGGTDGQLLVKNGSANYSARWEDPSEAVGNVVDEEIAKVHQVPAGGTTGQVLTKQSNADYDATWQDAGGSGGGVPDGGTTGQVLTKKSNANQDTEWTDQDFLPLAGGVMDEGATIKLPNASGDSTTIGPNSMSYAGADTFVMTGAFQVAGTMKGKTPVDPADFATKQYVDDHGGGGGGDEYVKKTGDTMTGMLSIDMADPDAGDFIKLLSSALPGSVLTMKDDEIIIWANSSMSKKIAEFSTTGIRIYDMDTARYVEITDSGISFNNIDGSSTYNWGMSFDPMVDPSIPQISQMWVNGTPTKPEHIATKQYVDQAIAGAKQAVAASLTMKGYTAAGAAIDPPTTEV